MRKRRFSKKMSFGNLMKTGFIFTLMGVLIFLVVPDKKVENETTQVVGKFSDITKDIKEKKGKGLCQISDSFDYYSYKEIPKRDERNNKFGLYIYAENESFFKLADKLVNSSGGDWGYVLIPYNVSDRDYSKWRIAFEHLNKRHLIPIIQLWDIDPDNYEEKTREAADFLNEFLWPIKERYISVYNETNDSKFWKGKVDPKNYADVLDYTIDVFKEENPDFFMLNGAFNVSAPSNSDYMDSFEYMLIMETAIPGIFEKLDGWASHPYPQPNFSGSKTASGRSSIRAYENELYFLANSLLVKKELPVFITETGWAHAEGENWNPSFLSDVVVAENLKYAFENVWLKDERVVAVTPFTIRYDPPFDHFSWVNKDNVTYHHYEVVKSIKKIAGNPKILEKKNIKGTACP